MEPPGKEVRFPFLAKLLFQRDDTLLLGLDEQALLRDAASSGRIYVVMSDDGRHVAIASGLRIVTLILSTPPGDSRLHIDDFAFATIGLPGDDVTSLTWVDFGGCGVEAPSACLAVGLHSGTIQFRSLQARLLASHRFFSEAVASIHVRPPGASLSQSTSRGDLAACWARGAAALDLGALAAACASEGAAKNALRPTLWDFDPNLGPRTHVLFLGPPPPTLLQALSAAPEPAAGATETPPSTSLLFATGSRPPFSWHSVPRGPGGGLLGAARRAAMRRAARAARDWLPSALVSVAEGGPGSSWEGESGGGGSPRALRAPTSTSLWDEARAVGRAAGSPCGLWALCCDDLGRVSLVDAAAGRLVAMLKGYREATCAWLAAADALRVVIHAPRKGVVEIWCAGLRRRLGVLRLRAGSAGLLVASARGSRVALFDPGMQAWFDLTAALHEPSD